MNAFVRLWNCNTEPSQLVESPSLSLSDYTHLNTSVKIHHCVVHRDAKLVVNKRVLRVMTAFLFDLGVEFLSEYIPLTFLTIVELLFANLPLLFDFIRVGFVGTWYTDRLSTTFYSLPVFLLDASSSFFNLSLLFFDLSKERLVLVTA